MVVDKDTFKSILNRSSFQIRDFDSIFSQKYELLEPIVITFEMSETQGSKRKLTFYMLDEQTAVSSISSDDDIYEMLLNRPPHSHNSWELMYVLDGSIRHRVEKINSIYPKGSCCLLRQGVNHCEEFTTDFQALFVTVSDELIQKILHEDTYRDQTGRISHYNQNLISAISASGNKPKQKEFIDFLPISEDGSILVEVEELLDKLVIDMSENRSGHIFYAQAMLSRLFAILTNKKHYQQFNNRLDATSEENLYARITKLIEQNNGRIKRDNLEFILSYSADHLNRITKKHSGMSLVELGQHICLHQAANMLKETDMKIAEILEHFGYSNRTYFNKIFREKYNVSPREYRKMSREE